MFKIKNSSTEHSFKDLIFLVLKYFHKFQALEQTQLFRLYCRLYPVAHGATKTQYFIVGHKFSPYPIRNRRTQSSDGAIYFAKSGSSTIPSAKRNMIVKMFLSMLFRTLVYWNRCWLTTVPPSSLVVWALQEDRRGGSGGQY